MVQAPYLTASAFLRERFGRRIFRVVVDAGFSCPNRDGTIGWGGCIFCSIEGFRPPTSRPDRTIRQQVEAALPALKRRYGRRSGFLVYFQPYTNTYGPAEKIESLLQEAISIPGSVGVVLGTRPDTLEPDVLDVLERFSRLHFLQVELGVQSTDDRTLEAMDRGHTCETSRRAIATLLSRGIRVGAHMILGTPWESPDSQIRGGMILRQAGVQSVKLHHLQVLKGSRLAAIWEGSGLELPDWREYGRIAAAFIRNLGPDIVVERLFASAPDRLLIAPRWDADAETVRRYIHELLTTQ